MFPTPFGPYELLRPLGAGGMAETFLAIRRGPKGFEQRVCLKRILPGSSGDAAFEELFLDEARLLAHLRHGRIVQVYDFGEVDGTYYMALELVEGADLAQLSAHLQTQDEHFSQDMVSFIATQLLEALEYAHTATHDGHPLGIVHRDVSPSNILISGHGEVKLTDFGIAKARGHKHRTRTGLTKGKLSYMSPEQLRGEPLDGRSDLFALGIVLYELLAGVHPFEADTDLALQNNILNATRRPLVELAPGASSALLRLVESLLAREANARPANAGVALTALHEAPGFRAQRALAAHVADYLREKRGRELLKPLHKPRSAFGSSTHPLRAPAKRGSGERISYPPHGTNRDLVAHRARRFGAKHIALLGAAGLAAAVGYVWNMTSTGDTNEADARPSAPLAQPETASVPTRRATSESVRAVSLRPESMPVIARAPEGALRPLDTLTTAAKVPDLQQDAGQPINEEASEAPRKRRKRHRATTSPINTATDVKATSTLPAQASKPAAGSPTRSGLGVSSDEF